MQNNEVKPPTSPPNPIPIERGGVWSEALLLSCQSVNSDSIGKLLLQPVRRYNSLSLELEQNPLFSTLSEPLLELTDVAWSLF